MRVLMAISLFAMSMMALAGEAIPKDVQAFIRNADACDHFAGEFDGDLSEARKKEIERAVVKYCLPAQK